MSTYRITAPDGSTYDVSGDGTQDEALAHFQSQWTPSGNPPQEVQRDTTGVPRVEVQGTSDSPEPTRETPSVVDPSDSNAPSLRDTIRGLLQPPPMPDFPALRADIAGGLVHGAAHLGNVVASPVQLGMDLYGNQPLGTTHQAASDTIDTDTASLANDPSSAAFNIASAGPEALLTGGPIARAGTAIASRLPQALGRLRPFLGDVAANVGYGTGKAAVQGEDPAQAALYSAGGAAGARVLTRTLGGAAKPFVSQEAQRLLDAGVTPTPGQLFGDGVVGSTIRAAEDKATSLPITGDIINYARKRSLGDYNRVETNAALQPFQRIVDSPNPAFNDARQAIGSPTVSGAGSDAVGAAQKKVSAAFSEALDGMDLWPQHIHEAIGATREAIDHIPLLDERQAAQLNHYINLRVAPHVEGGITGEGAKALDAEMGSYARKYSRSVNPADHPLGDAFYALQENWRRQMAQAAQDAGLGHKTALLNAANAVHRNLLPIVRATDRAAAQGGVFTPGQLQRSHGPYYQTPSPLNTDAQAVLPSRVPDSGSAGRLLLSGFGLLKGAALPAAVAAALYTKPGVAFLVNGLGGAIPNSVRQRLLAATPDQAVQLMRDLAQRNPQFGQQLSAQVGRMVAMQQRPQGATQ